MIQDASPCLPAINWDSYVVNDECPKFLSTPIEHGGLGDQLERFVFSLHVATVLNATVVNDGFGRRSEHYSVIERFSRPYAYFFENLFGFHILSTQKITDLYNPRTVRLNYSAAAQLGSLGPCNTHFVVSVWSCAYVRPDRGGEVDRWCPHTPGLASAALESVRWQVRYSYLSESCAARTFTTTSRWHKTTAVNVVWHVRTGDLCMHCSDSAYFLRVHDLIMQAVEGCRINLVVLSQHVLQSMSEMRLSHVTYLSLSDMFDFILKSDFLITTGSTLPIMLAAFSHPFNFLVLEESKHDAPQGAAHVFSSAFTVPMDNGTLFKGTDKHVLRSILLSSLHNKRKVQHACLV